MNREYHQSDLIELGVASVDTKGALTGMHDDEEDGWRFGLALTDD